MTAAVRLCIAAGIASGVCHAEGANLPASWAAPIPEWATQEWIHDAAGIVAGETVPHCAECDLWIACTIVSDVANRGYHPWRLRPAEAGRKARWYGWREPSEQHLIAIRDALTGRCIDTPECTYLGSLSDYAGNWRHGLAWEREVRVIGNKHGAIVCVPFNED